MLAGNTLCSSPLDAASMATDRLSFGISVLLRIFASTLRRMDSLLCNKWSILEAFDAFVSNTDEMIFDGIHGIDSRVMSTSNLHVSDSTPTNYDHSVVNDYQVKAISTVSVNPKEAWTMHFYLKRTNADVSISSHPIGGLLHGDLLISPHRR
jgi:hypothetical protein